MFGNQDGYFIDLKPVLSILVLSNIIKVLRVTKALELDYIGTHNEENLWL